MPRQNTESNDWFLLERLRYMPAHTQYISFLWLVAQFLCFHIKAFQWTTDVHHYVICQNHRCNFKKGGYYFQIGTWFNIDLNNFHSASLSRQRHQLNFDMSHVCWNWSPQGGLGADTLCTWHSISLWLGVSESRQINQYLERNIAFPKSLPLENIFVSGDRKSIHVLPNIYIWNTLENS